MILYNTTFKVDLNEIVNFRLFLDDFFKNLKDETDLFQLLNEDSLDGITYCFQIKFEDSGTFNTHIAVYDAKFKQAINNTFGEKVLFFSSILKKI